MLTSNIKYFGFNNKKKFFKVKNKIEKILKEENYIINSLSKNYKYSFNKKTVLKYKKYKNYRVIGMGGSSLGTQAIYDFLRKRIKKNFSFIDNLSSKNNNKYKNIKNNLNLIISKSGNTIETIANSNVLIKKKQKNIFITENKKSYLYSYAEKLKSEIIHHNNYIGGRYSVLSEVGMLPAELMGLKSSQFKQLNNLIKNKNFINKLVANVEAIIFL